MVLKSVSLLALSGLAVTDAFSVPEAASSFSSLLASSLSNAMPNTLVRRDNCPAIWTTISSDLTASFLGSDGQCTDLARAAIRFAFHDAGPYSSKTTFYAPAAGGADGSLLLNADEINRPDNGGLGDYRTWLLGKYNQYNQQAPVGAADLIQFAGSHAVVTCPGGPKVKTVVGRTDSSTAAPDGFLPAGFGANSSHDVLYQLFLDKGFSARDLAALIGAHSTSKAFTQQANGIPAGGQQDTTPGKWDIDYYAQVNNPPAGVYRFQSDVNLAAGSTTVGKQFQGFVGNRGKWTSSFADAMARLSVLGIPSSAQKSFIDCTNVLPRGTSSKRDIRAAPINERAR